MKFFTTILFQSKQSLLSIALLMLFSIFISCSSDLEESGIGQVQFGVSNFINTDASNARTGNNQFSIVHESSSSIDLENNVLLINIEDSNGNTHGPDGEPYGVQFAPIVQVNGSYYAPTFDLPAGNYRITYFGILEFPSYDFAYAVPLVGSPLADMVDQPLPFDFSVAPDVLNTYSLELLSAENTEPSDFGFSKIEFGIFDLDELPIAIYGQDDSGNAVLVDARLILTTIVDNEVIYDQNLPAGVHSILISEEHINRDVFDPNFGNPDIQIIVESEGYEGFTDDVIMSDLILSVELFNYIHDIHLEKINP